MRCPGLAVFLALILGSLVALYLPGGSLAWLTTAAVAAWQLALVAFVGSRLLLFVVAALSSIALAAAAAATHTDWQRQHAPIRAIRPPLSAPLPRAEPVTIEGVVVDDASVGADGVMMRVRVDRVRWDRAVIDLEGGVLLSIGGAVDPARTREWTRGRRIRAPATLRRPARYLNDGVADAELASTRRGVALIGSVKSASLVEVIAPASRWNEAFARARARVRRVIAVAMGGDPEAAAVVTAILIGDRGGLSNDVEHRMQRAGTYHVIAISGGNVALFAMLTWGASRLVLGSRRLAIVSAMFIVAAYGLLVGAGASVGRAVAAALLFLLATLLDHRAPPLNVVAVVGIIFLLWDPLALVDLGFLLSFGATAGILLATPGWLAALKRRTQVSDSPNSRARIGLALAAMIAATAAAEIALLPIQATAFHRLTVAGVLLNLLAIPAMAVAQIAGIAIVISDLTGIDGLVSVSAVFGQFAARALVDSARLVDLVPSLTWRVAAPPAWLVGIYVMACATLAWRRWPRLRGALAVTAMVAGAAMAVSAPARIPRSHFLQLTMFDVGQAEAVMVRLPGGGKVLFDSGGRSGRFDVGDRVLVPALLARGATRLDWFLLTHPDLDHVGGGLSVIADLRPGRVLEGIAPPLNRERNLLMQAAAASGASVESLRAGGSFMREGVLFRVLHPTEPEWERQDVRNDDSVVTEVRFGSISIVLTGDVSEVVEPSIASQLVPARLRVLKAGHHGSRTSTSQAFLDAVRPAAVLISAGRANFYGHPSTVVLSRLRKSGAEIFRTDHDGQIDLTTDGRTIEIRTFLGRRWAITAAR